MYCSNSHKQKAYRIRRKNKLQTVTSQQDHVTDNAVLDELKKITDLLTKLASTGIVATHQTPQNEQHDTPLIDISNLPELDIQTAKVDNKKLEQNFLNSLNAMVGKPKPAKNTIKQMTLPDAPLPLPDFSEMEL